MAKSSLLDLFKAATADDITEIDGQIATLEKEIADREAEIASLRLVRRTIDIKINGKPERKPRTKPEPQNGNGHTDGKELPELIYDVLSKEGSLPIGVICSRINVSRYRVQKVVTTHEWFETNQNGDIEIATT